MKTMKFILTLGFFCCLILISCEMEIDTIKNEYKFRVEFSDGSEISENEILYYDSSSHFLFLKENIDFNQSVSGFNVFVDNEIIYSGIKHSCDLSSPPPVTFFITDCFQYGQDILEIGYYPYSQDLRNDPRLINALKETNLLRNGLECKIDSIKVDSFDNYSEVFCQITITNNDFFDYYILDPGKMGELDFNYYTGGLSFQNVESKVHSFLRWSVSNPDYGNLTINDFSILSGKSQVTYTFKSSDYYKMDKGIYKATFRFCGLKYNVSEFDLTQDKGRIWVGEAISKVDIIIAE